MIRMDTLILVAQIQVIVKTADSYRTFVSQTGEEASRLLDLLHELIDWGELPGRTRAQFTAALVRLSKKSGCHPEFLGLSGLTRSGSHAVAAGAFGDIWKGILRGQDVSVKVARVFRDDDVQRFVKAFYTEAILWGQLSHPNVLPLYGIYYLNNEETSQLCMVSPWMENGNIVRFLKDAPPSSVNHRSLMLDVALGMEYLHKESVVHGDMKGLNILITPSFRACLMDFGLSSIADSQIPNWTSLSTQHSGGTARWQSPEILEGEPNSFKGDVYAFGCVCYEIFAGQVPFHELSNDMAVSLRIIRGSRPARPETPLMEDDVWNLIRDCWKQDPDERPTAGQIVQRLSSGGSVRETVNEWDESFARGLRRSLRRKQLIPSPTELKALLRQQGAEEPQPAVLRASSLGLHSTSETDVEVARNDIYQRVAGPSFRPRPVSPAPLKSILKRPSHYQGSSSTVSDVQEHRPNQYLDGIVPNGDILSANTIFNSRRTWGPFEDPSEISLYTSDSPWSIGQNLPGPAGPDRDFSFRSSRSTTFMADPGCVLNPLLLFKPGKFKSIRYDLRYDCRGAVFHRHDLIQSVDHYSGLSPAEYDQLATDPPTETIRIRYPDQDINSYTQPANGPQWLFDIVGGPHTGITVRDVLQQIYQYMLSGTDAKQHFETLEVEDQRKVTRAYNERCRGRSAYLALGVLRMDFLAVSGRFMFIGFKKRLDGLLEMNLRFDDNSQVD
ncbi:kinase-like domain-containing protein [Mycena floridula]|nr:kinase-like domain-containing protein [Mycena floridula]